MSPRTKVRSRRDGAERRAYLHALMGTLWPEPCRLDTSRRAESADGRAQDFVVVPHDRNPTLVLPRRPRQAAATGLRHYKTSAGRRTRLTLQVLSAAARFGLLDLLPNRLTVWSPTGSPAAGIDSYLGSALGTTVHVCVYIGPPRAIEKPVLQLIGDRGERLGFVKVGTNSLTRALVRGEAGALAALSAQSLATLVTPRLLHHSQWHGHEVLVQETLTNGQRVGGADPLLVTAMVELAGIAGLTRTPMATSPFWRRLVDRVAALDDESHAHVLRRAIETVEELAGSEEILVGAWHGDFAPWNMTRAGDRLQVWDWEHFNTDVPVGFDALHYRVQTLVVDEGQTALAAVTAMCAEAPALLGPFDVDPTTADLVAVAYVLEIAARYLHDGEHEAGTRMGNLGSWLSEVVAAQIATVTTSRSR